MTKNGYQTVAKVVLGRMKSRGAPQVWILRNFLCPRRTLAMPSRHRQPILISNPGTLIVGPWLAPFGAYRTP